MRRLANIALLIFATTGSVSCWAQRSAASTTGTAFTASDVEFRSGEVIVSGTAGLPARIWAAAVLVQGSGRQERNIGLTKWLANQGIASLTYDKRGVGKSGGVYGSPAIPGTIPRNT